VNAEVHNAKRASRLLSIIFAVRCDFDLSVVLQSEDCDPDVVVGILGTSDPRTNCDRTILAPVVLRRSLGLLRCDFDLIVVLQPEDCDPDVVVDILGTVSRAQTATAQHLHQLW
jgi:hypothetical protein